MKLFLILSIFFLLSCSGNKTVKEREVGFFKVRKGTSWIYRATLLGEKRDLEIKITEKNDKFLTDNKGQKYIKDEKGYKNGFFYLIKYPLKKGNTWIIKSKEQIKVATIEDTAYTFNFEGEKIKNCLKISYINALEDSSRNIVIRYFCPGLWLVKMETYYESPEGIATKQSDFTLKSFSY